MSMNFMYMSDDNQFGAIIVIVLLAFVRGMIALFSFFVGMIHSVWSRARNSNNEVQIVDVSRRARTAPHVRTDDLIHYGARSPGNRARLLRHLRADVSEEPHDDDTVGGTRGAHSQTESSFVQLSLPVVLSDEPASHDIQEFAEPDCDTNVLNQIVFGTFWALLFIAVPTEFLLGAPLLAMRWVAWFVKQFQQVSRFLNQEWYVTSTKIHPSKSADDELI